MYLHHQLVDNLILLQTKQKLQQLQSTFTFKITNDRYDDRYDDLWIYFNTYKNTITLLRFQWGFSYYGHQICYMILETKHFNYIKGIINTEQIIIERAARYDNMDIFDICIKNNVLPDINTLNSIGYNANIIIFNKCLKYVSCNQQTMRSAAYYGNTKIFKICLEQGLRPDRATMNIIDRYWNPEITQLIK